MVARGRGKATAEEDAEKIQMDMFSKSLNCGHLLNFGAA
jgi:hypothetical protein